MSRLALPLLALLLTWPAAWAADEDAAPWLDLSRAAVLGSPGVPRALDAFLPGGTPPQPLTWPLPPGPLLVLGLPETDPLARRIADLFALPVEAEDLAGGYRLWAWRDGDRPLAFLYAADPAALHAARFAFDADIRADAPGGGVRSLDFARPNEEAALGVPFGTAGERPRYRVRALAPGADLRDHDEIAVAGARGNRLWLDPRRLDAGRIRRALPALRRGGVAPVLVLHAQAGPGEADGAADALAAAARPWQRDHGVRHVALVFETPWGALRAAGGRNGAHEARLVAALAARLRREGLDEIAVVPRCFSDRLAGAWGPPPDLAAVPEALVAWSGPLEHSITISRADARRRVRAARGVPVLLYETWSAPFEARAHVPSAPRGRDPRLPDLLEGTVVVGRAGADATLASAWGPEQTERFGLDLLLPLLTPGANDARAFLEASATRLEREHRANAGIAPWMRPLAQGLRLHAKALAQGREAVLVPRVPEAIVPDGRLDERPWAFAGRLPLAVKGVDVLVLADGSALRMGLRMARPQSGKTAFPLRIALGIPDRYDLHTLEMTPGAVRLDLPDDSNAGSPPEPGHVTVARGEAPDRYTAEVTFDRFALHGDAFAGRCFALTVSWGPPPEPGSAPSMRTSLLVLVP